MGLKQAKIREEELRLQIRQLSEPQRKAFYRDFNDQIKDPDTYATLNYLFIAGLHHFYLGKVIWGLTDIGLFILGLMLMLSGSIAIGLIIIIAVTVFELKALFQSEAIVADYNNRLMQELLDKVQRGGY